MYAHCDRSATKATTACSAEVDAKHAQLMSASAAAMHSGDLSALTELLASDVRIFAGGAGKVRATFKVVQEGGEDAGCAFRSRSRSRHWNPPFPKRLQ